MNNVDEIINHWRGKFSVERERFAGLIGRFRLNLKMVDGKVLSWLLNCDDELTLAPIADEKSVSAADCTITVSEDDFVNLANHRMNPQVAFLSGKIKVEGSYTKALQFSRFF